MKLKIIFLFSIANLFACGQNKSLQATNPDGCDTQAKVLDYTGLDGCRFLLELKDGTRLIPVELADKNFLFSEGQIVQIKYSLLKDVVTACLTAALPVSVTCIKEVKPGTKQGQVFLKRDCLDTETPLSISWMNKLVIRNKVTEVKKGYLNADPFYLFFGNVYVQIYNCTGEAVCEYELKSTSSCKSKYDVLTDLKSVWSLK